MEGEKRGRRLKGRKGKRNLVARLQDGVGLREKGEEMAMVNFEEGWGEISFVEDYKELHQSCFVKSHIPNVRMNVLDFSRLHLCYIFVLTLVYLFAYVSFFSSGTTII